MNRMLLIARREYMAYAKTVGFWLSLLSFPLFAVVGGGVSYMMNASQPVRSVAVIEEGASGAGLAQAVEAYQAQELERRRVSSLASAAMMEARQEGADRVRHIAETQGIEAGLAELRRVAPRGAAGWKEPRRMLVLAPAPAEIIAAAPGQARDAAARAYLDGDEKSGRELDGIVLLTRDDKGPAARVWTTRTTDDEIEDFAREALRSANRAEVLARAGVDPAVIDGVSRFRPDVTTYSPRSVGESGQVSLRDRLPGIIGLASGFLLWSLIITGASILLNSVMEEKSNKILEVLLSSASATEVLTGKVLGVALVTLTMLAAWAVLGIGALTTFAPPEVASDVTAALGNPSLLIYFVLYMVGGYLMYAVLFAAIGAFCETPRDAQTLMGPIMMVLMVPMFAMTVALRTPDAPMIKILSWIPPFTPFLMSARAPSGPPLLEVIATMLGMFVFAALMVWLAGRAFRAGALADVKLNWKSFANAIRGAGR